MDEPIKVSVKTGTLSQRCRAGFVFTREAQQIEVTAVQLKALQDDGHLQVEVLSQDDGAKQAQKETGNQAQNAENQGSSGDLNPDDGDSDVLNVLVATMRANGIDGTSEKAPIVADVKKLVNFDVNASLRDAAWAQLVEEAKQ